MRISLDVDTLNVLSYSWDHLEHKISPDVDTLKVYSYTWDPPVL